MGEMKRLLLAIAIVVGVPLAAFAQATLSGVVKDPSGGVLPGVTVEASSSVLIEKTRSGLTDSTGRYTIPDLRPGTYRITFTLTGFKSVVRDGIILSGTAVFDVNAELEVGNLQETITVSGDTPIVNLQSTTRQAVMDQEIVSAIPSSRTPFTVGVLIPGVRKGAFTGQDVGGSVVQEVASLEANGGRTSDQRMMVNGVALSSMIAGGWGGGAVPNATGTAEFAIDVSGVDAQAATGGVRINFIPRDGGNRYSGTIAASYAHNNFASDNFTGSDVQDLGLSAPGTVKANGDFNPGFGGPIKRDKLWFFLSGRSLFADNYVAGMFFNQNANRLDRYDYVPSPDQAILHQEQTIYQARLTWQAAPKHKIGVTYDQENFCACTTGLGPTPTGLVAPEAGNDRRFPLQRFVTMDWNTPVSNRLLIEASGIHRVERWGGMHPQVGKLGNIDHLEPGMISVTDSQNPVTGGSLTYRAAQTYNNSWNWNIHYRAAVSYITGSHTFKVGFNNAYGHHENTTYSDPARPYAYNFTAMTPAAIVYNLTPRTVEVNVNRDLGLFVQDKWTTGRWTLSGALRYDSFKNSFPEQTVAGNYFGRTLNIHYDKIDNLSWHDITPRLGATYDVFGTGRTAVKVTLNKYLEGLGTTGFGAAQVTDAPNPVLSLLTTTQRVWGDADRDFVPDCDLNNFAANGECLALDNAAIFGTVTPNRTYDPDLMTGWGKRAFNWEFTSSVQHEIVPRMSVEVQYARRWYGNIRLMDDRSVSASDYTPVNVTTPSDSRLPGGGGYPLTVMTISPTAAAQNYFVTLSNNYGKQTEHFNGVNVSVNARLQNGLLLQGGMGTGRQVLNDCDVVDDLPEMLHTFFGDPTRAFFFAERPRDFCEQNNGFRTQLQGLAAYTLPKVGVQISGTFQNLPGAVVQGNTNFTALPPGVIPGTVSGAGLPLQYIPFKAVQIVAPGELYVERLNQIDLRIAKIFRLRGGARTNINFDFYNVLNSNSITGANFAYSSTIPGPGRPGWLSPTSILTPRLFKIGAQFDF
jgi:carboxypeptidase family protein